MARNAAPDPYGRTRPYPLFEEIRRFPMLERQEEYMLAKRWREHGDRDAAHKLVTSHLRLVTKIARDYRGYGLPISEAISEGNVGLMQAVERFEPEKGFRFATYAVWWIKAAIQEYILRSWSLVKMGRGRGGWQEGGGGESEDRSRRWRPRRLCRCVSFQPSPVVGETDAGRVALGTFYGNRTTREGRRSPGADRALARRSMHGTLHHRSGA